MCPVSDLSLTSAADRSQIVGNRYRREGRCPRMAKPKEQPPRNQDKKVRRIGEEATWHKPDFRIVEASMEMSAYFLATR